MDLVTNAFGEIELTSVCIDEKPVAVNTSMESQDSIRKFLVCFTHFAEFREFADKGVFIAASKVYNIIPFDKDSIMESISSRHNAEFLDYGNWVLVLEVPKDEIPEGSEYPDKIRWDWVTGLYYAEVYERYYTIMLSNFTCEDVWAYCNLAIPSSNLQRSIPSFKEALKGAAGIIEHVALDTYGIPMLRNVWKGKKGEELLRLVRDDELSKKYSPEFDYEAIKVIHQGVGFDREIGILL